MCQAVLETYACDLIFDVIKCFTGSFSLPKASARAQIGDVEGFFAALSSAGSEIGDEMANRYGGTGLFKAMFVDKKLIHSICSFAFTGTWSLDLDTLFDMSMQEMPLESSAIIYPCERRFIGYDPASYPVKGMTKWLYHFGIGVAAGSDLDLRLKLKCSQGYKCSVDDGFEKGECDCKQGERELEVTPPELAGTVKKYDVFNKEIYIPLQVDDSAVRYDTAELTWSWTAPDGTLREDSATCRIGQTGTPPPAFCSFDAFTLTFRCVFGEQEGGVRIRDVQIYAPHKLGEFEGKEKAIIKRTTRFVQPDKIIYNVTEFGKGKRNELESLIRNILNKFYSASKVTDDHIAQIELINLRLGQSNMAQAILFPLTPASNVLFLAPYHLFTDIQPKLKEGEISEANLQLTLQTLNKNQETSFISSGILAYSKEADLVIGLARTTEEVNLQQPGFSKDYQENQKITIRPSKVTRKSGTGFETSGGILLGSTKLFIYSDARTVPGYSGSPFLNTQDKILGTIEIGVPSQLFSVATKSEFVEKLLKFYISGNETKEEPIEEGVLPTKEELIYLTSNETVNSREVFKKGDRFNATILLSQEYPTPPKPKYNKFLAWEIKDASGRIIVQKDPAKDEFIGKSILQTNGDYSVSTLDNGMGEIRITDDWFGKGKVAMKIWEWEEGESKAEISEVIRPSDIEITKNGETFRGAVNYLLVIDEDEKGNLVYRFHAPKDDSIGTDKEGGFSVRGARRYLSEGKIEDGARYKESITVMDSELGLRITINIPKEEELYPKSLLEKLPIKKKERKRKEFKIIQKQTRGSVCELENVKTRPQLFEVTYRVYDADKYGSPTTIQSIDPATGMPVEVKKKFYAVCEMPKVVEEKISLRAVKDVLLNAKETENSILKRTLEPFSKKNDQELGKE
ncbi:MAG TPA: hypothetical protein ENF94_01405, partial [Candidatus Woesearchaeota archaeon]|nr:hypothetical protein [Candidatus Woesearchaeota archaeon]